MSAKKPIVSPAVPPVSEPDCGDAGDDSFRSLCLRHLPALYSVALRMTRKSQDAEDLVQETYLKAVRSSGSFDPCSSDCKAWLFKIMTNTFIDQYRRAAKEPTIVGLPEGDEVADPRPQDRSVASAEPLQKLLDADVAAALDALPERFRVPLLLCDVEGFSYAEIADMLRIPVGTVMSRLYRGRRLLKAALLDYARSQGYAVATGETAGG